MFCTLAEELGIIKDGCQVSAMVTGASNSQVKYGVGTVSSMTAGAFDTSCWMSVSLL